jgi:hypothetical protein
MFPFTLDLSRRRQFQGVFESCHRAKENGEPWDRMIRQELILILLVPNIPNPVQTPFKKKKKYKKYKKNNTNMQVMLVLALISIGFSVLLFPIG